MKSIGYLRGFSTPKTCSVAELLLMDIAMDNLYREEILDHYRSPRHRGRLSSPDATFEDDNPLCGDRVRMDVRFGEDSTIAEVRFCGEGCAICQATASMLCDDIAGKSISEVTGWDKEKVLELLSISLTPVRLKCALLPLKVLQAALWKFLEQSAPRTNRDQLRRDK
jgi:nitrogen fixation protein NifU and related proteins